MTNETLKQALELSEHSIPQYAYGDNEAACEMASRLEKIAEILRAATDAEQAKGREAVVYPPDGTTSPFTVINLGQGAVQMGDAIHDDRLPALWFGKNGKGMGHIEDLNRRADEGETLAVVTFSNVDGLDVLLDVVHRIRAKAFPDAVPYTDTPAQPARDESAGSNAQQQADAELQPAREWVGLDAMAISGGTVEKGCGIGNGEFPDVAFAKGARWAESKLREKNAGQPVVKEN